jgi:porphobilinogen deaminase
MNAMRETWTDERLDDLNDRVSDGFRRVDEDIRSLRGEMNTRFDALQRRMVQFGGAMIVALVGLIGTQLYLIATQL